MSDQISAKQQQILDYIKDEILKKGYPPTVRDIGEAVNLKSTSSVFSHLAAREFDTAKAAKPAMALFFCLFLFLRIAYMRIWWYNKYMTTMSCRGDAYAYYER